MNFTALAWTEPETSICNWSIFLFALWSLEHFFPTKTVEKMEILDHLKHFPSSCMPSHGCIWDTLSVPQLWGAFPGASALCLHALPWGLRVSAWVLVESRTRPVTEMWNLQGACLSRCSQYLKSVWLCDAQVSVPRNASKLQPRVGLLVS